MLDDKEIKKIKEGIEQGKSNYRIGKETHHSPNTIDPIRKSMKETEQRKAQGEEVLVKSPIDIVRGITSDINALIHSKQLDDRQRKDWEKRAEQLQEILKVKVDDRIAQERADAVQKRDKEWNEFLQQSYVKKRSSNRS